MNNRIELRAEKLKLRDSLTEGEREEKSRKIEVKILDLDEIKRAKNIFIYVSFKSEVQTLHLIEELMKQGKKISVPLTHVKKKRIDAIHIEDLSKDLVSGYCGILEPPLEKIEGRVVDPLNIDVVILPGSVFDRRGGRFGYGGGFYDRFLENIPYAVRIGLAFELQIEDEVPLQPHDELLDYIVSEERTVKIDRI